MQPCWNPLVSWISYYNNYQYSTLYSFNKQCRHYHLILYSITRILNYLSPFKIKTWITCLHISPIMSSIGHATYIKLHINLRFLSEEDWLSLRQNPWKCVISVLMETDFISISEFVFFFMCIIFVQTHLHWLLF